MGGGLEAMNGTASLASNKFSFSGNPPQMQKKQMQMNSPTKSSTVGLHNL